MVNWILIFFSMVGWYLKDSFNHLSLESGYLKQRWLSNQQFPKLLLTTLVNAFNTLLNHICWWALTILVEWFVGKLQAIRKLSLPINPESDTVSISVRNISLCLNSLPGSTEWNERTQELLIFLTQDSQVQWKNRQGQPIQAAGNPGSPWTTLSSVDCQPSMYKWLQNLHARSLASKTGACDYKVQLNSSALNSG